MNNLIDLIIHFHKPIVLACSVLLVALLLLRQAEKRGRLSKVFLLVIILAMAAVIYPTRGDMTLSIPSMLVLLTALFNLFQNWKPANAPVPVKEQGEGIRQYEERLRVVEQRLLAMQTGDAVLDDKERYRLEQELKTVQEKLANLQQSYEEELERRRNADKALNELQEELPDTRIAAAKESLKKGDTETAEQAFDEVVDKEGKSVALAAYQSGQLAEGRVDYAKAMRQYTKAVTLGEDNPDYLLAAGWMALKTAAYRNAEKWLTRLLKIREAKGEEDAKLGIVLNNLALLYKTQGRYEEAEPIYRRALEIVEKSQGKDHPDVATTLNNLAALYELQGSYDEAEPLFKRSLEIREDKLGKDHPDVAQCLNNLAELYREQGLYEEAEPLYRRALEIWEEPFGKEHPNVASTLNNLAELHRQQDRYEEAEPLYKRALEIRENKLGKNHPDVAQSLNNLAELYREQGLYEEAESLYRRALKFMVKSLGKEHPNVATILNNLALLYHAQGRYAEAEPLYLRVQKIDKKNYGKDHPSVATTLNNLALLYGGQDLYEEAEPLYQRAIAIMQTKFPNGHPNLDTFQSNYNALKKKMTEEQ